MNLKQHPERDDIWVTPEGRVFRELTPSLDDGGYMQIRNGNFRRRRGVLVCEVYHGTRPRGLVMRHRDGDSLNDVEDNVCWGTQAENMADAMVHGTTTRGGKNEHAVLTLMQVREIKRRLERFSHGTNVEQLAKHYNVNRATIYDIKAGRTWSWA